MVQKSAMNLPLQLDRTASEPLQDQLFEKLRQLILSGRLKPNTRVIATRFLAEQVGVSRRTVLFAYERLIAEGYLETRPAIGTFVSPTPPAQAKLETAAAAVGDVARQAALYPASLRASTQARAQNHPPVPIDFIPQRQDSSLVLPQKIWLRWMRDILMSDPLVFAKPAPVGGAEALREVIANYLGATRGILALPDQIIIVSGRRQAASLVAHLFQRQNDRVVVETPGDPAISDFFQLRGACVVSVPVDGDGLKISDLPEGRTALAYVTPARQNPIGGIMPQSRRSDLIEWARDAGAYLIEDDCDGDLRHQGAAHAPLAALDSYGLVFHVGSFGKTLGAGLSLGYLLVPPEFIDDVLAIKAMASEGGQHFEQLVVANLIASGEYDHHLRRLRKIYLERRDALILALKARLGDIMLLGTECGTQMSWVLQDDVVSAATLQEAALARGVRVGVIKEEAAQASGFNDRTIILGYPDLSTDRLREGVAILADAYQKLR